MLLGGLTEDFYIHPQLIITIINTKYIRPVVMLIVQCSCDSMEEFLKYDHSPVVLFLFQAV